MIYDIRDVRCDKCGIWLNHKDFRWFGYFNGLYVCKFCEENLR